MISREYIKDLLWNKLVNLPEFEFAKLHSEFQGFYIKNTWRSWRTWGISGGMVPWRDAYGWKPKNGTVKLPFKDGALGWQPAQMNVRGYYGMSDKGTETTASGSFPHRNMSPILMYIGGKPEAFYGQDAPLLRRYDNFQTDCRHKRQPRRSGLRL